MIIFDISDTTPGYKHQGESMNKITAELIEQELAKYEDAWQEEIKQAKIFKEEDAKLKLTQSLWDKNVEKVNARAKLERGKGRLAMGILDEEGNIVDIIVQDRVAKVVKVVKAPVVKVNEGLTEKEEKYLRKKVLDLCYQGIKTLDYFIEKYPKLYLKRIEKVKEDLYRITYNFD
jgi:hypothetical protein